MSRRRAVDPWGYNAVNNRKLQRFPFGWCGKQEPSFRQALSGSYFLHCIPPSSDLAACPSPSQLITIMWKRTNPGEISAALAEVVQGATCLTGTSREREPFMATKSLDPHLSSFSFRPQTPCRGPTGSKNNVALCEFESYEEKVSSMIMLVWSTWNIGVNGPDGP